MPITRTFLLDAVQTVPKWCTRGRTGAADGGARVSTAEWGEVESPTTRGHQSGFFIPSPYPLPEGPEGEGMKG